MNDFRDPDISWALRKVYLSTVVERNFAEVIADLPAIFQIARSIHRKVVTIITQGSRATSKTSSRGQSGILTIGSVHKRFYNIRRSSFAAYGDTGQFTTIHNSSEAEIPLRDRKEGTSVADINGGTNVDRGITVQVDIDVESQERKSNEPFWPKGSLRPEN